MKALRVAKSNKMPKWIPGKLDGEPVRVYFTLPVFFRLGKQYQYINVYH